MTGIFNRIKTFFKRKKKKQNRTNRKPMFLINFFAIMFSLLIIVYVIAWILDAIYTLVPKLSEFRNFINSFIGMTLVVGFIATYLYDKNGDGVPDIIDKNVSEGKITTVDTVSSTRISSKLSSMNEERKDR